MWRPKVKGPHHWPGDICVFPERQAIHPSVSFCLRLVRHVHFKLSPRRVRRDQVRPAAPQPTRRDPVASVGRIPQLDEARKLTSSRPSRTRSVCKGTTSPCCSVLTLPCPEQDQELPHFRAQLNAAKNQQTFSTAA
jgi:hypothetical protein